MAGEAIKVGAKAGLSLLESSLLGAFAILCLGIAVAAVWLLYRTQNARVADQRAMSDKIEGLVRHQAEFNTKASGAIDKLSDSDRQQATLLQNIQQGVNILLMQRGNGG